MDTVFIECFGELKEPRVEQTKKHLLLDVLALSICGVLSEAKGWEEIKDVAKEHEGWFRKSLTLPHGIPSHDTISRVFSALNPKGLQSSYVQWLKRISQLIAEDILNANEFSVCPSPRIRLSRPLWATDEVKSIKRESITERERSVVP